MEPITPLKISQPPPPPVEVGDCPAPDRKTWGMLVAVITNNIRVKGGKTHHAKDIVQDAFRIAAERKRSGNKPPPDDPTLFAQYMYEICLGIAANFRRAADRNKTDQLEKPHWVRATNLSPHEELERAERLHVVDLVKKALEDDSQGAVPLMMFEKAGEDGIEGRCDLARELGVPEAVIQKAERRIEKVAGQVLKKLRMEQFQRTKRRTS
jgi:DNA-directed RNA polymerase specialized sigma24 family protein